MSNEGRICPQCSYERQPKDLAPDYECPRCGIIYAKYRPPEPASSPAAGAAAGRGNPPTPGQAKGATREENRPDERIPEEDEEWKLLPATPLRRALAGIYTFSLVLLYFVPAKLVVYASFRLTHSPNPIDPWTNIGKIRNWETAYYTFLVLLVVYAFLLRPWLEGRSWGQEKFSLAVRPKDDQEGALTFKDYFLRFVGQLIVLCTWPVTIGGLLYNLVAKRNDPGIADRISSTRQYETGEPLRLRRDVNRAFLPACIALILQFALVGPLSHWIMKGYFEKPRTGMQQSTGKVENALREQMQQMRMGHAAKSAEGPASVPTAPEAKAAPTPDKQARMTERRLQEVRQNSISIISAMEKRQLRDRGSYTEDLETLVAQYGSNPNETDELLKLVLRGTLRARKTTQGVEIWLQTPAGEWIYEEVRK